ncbi:hypothetical protein SKAU_G00336990 [Synaphobranchus kaupii]|uniref:Uncharacterized protein n=1 Tax=Synaphobranchus kaupii TaxID=118154 RepID=A0A9Q1EMA4_SYNKA|nr:hypothetical protein SKAU_G00336990 [Synaphobranchus kaupii]
MHSGDSTFLSLPYTCFPFTLQATFPEPPRRQRRDPAPRGAAVPDPFRLWRFLNRKSLRVNGTSEALCRRVAFDPARTRRRAIRGRGGCTEIRAGFLDWEGREPRQALNFLITVRARTYGEGGGGEVSRRLCRRLPCVPKVATSSGKLLPHLTWAPGRFSIVRAGFATS